MAGSMLRATSGNFKIKKQIHLSLIPLRRDIIQAELKQLQVNILGIKSGRRHKMTEKEIDYFAGRIRRREQRNFG